jgi:hypothetical protein
MYKYKRLIPAFVTIFGSPLTAHSAALHPALKIILKMHSEYPG